MKKGLGVLMVVAVVIFCLAVVVAGVGFYFYDYHVFKTIRLCVGDGIDSGMFCGSSFDCVDFAREQGLDVNLSGAPDFIVDKFQEIVDYSIYCNSTCFVRKVRGASYEMDELGLLDSCNEEETEFVVEIRGREGIEIYRYLKSRK